MEKEVDVALALESPLGGRQKCSVAHTEVAGLSGSRGKLPAR